MTLECLERQYIKALNSCPSCTVSKKQPFDAHLADGTFVRLCSCMHLVEETSDVLVLIQTPLPAAQSETVFTLFSSCRCLQLAVASRFSSSVASQSSKKPLLIPLVSPVSLVQELSDHGIDGKFRPSETNSGFHLGSEKLK